MCLVPHRKISIVQLLGFFRDHNSRGKRLKVIFQSTCFGRQYYENVDDPSSCSFNRTIAKESPTAGSETWHSINASIEFQICLTHIASFQGVSRIHRAGLKGENQRGRKEKGT